MKTVTMVVQVAPGKKALHLCQEYAEIQAELSELRAEFTPRNQCKQITEDNKKTCRDLKIEHCPRCEATEPLAQEWHELKARKSNVLKKIRALGCKALDDI